MAWVKRVDVARPGATAWRLAEAKMEAGTDPLVAAQGLPLRQVWLLRAMAALHDGRRSEVASIADAADKAGHGDVALLLRTLLTRPGQAVPPSESNIPAGDRGQLDRAEALRCLQSWHQGKNPRGTKVLQTMRRARPALHAFLELVAKTAGKVYRSPDLAALSPRAEGVLLAGRGVILRWGDVRQSLSALGDLGLDLSVARYPDLVDLTPRSALRAWIAGDGAWNATDDALVGGAIRGAAAERRRTLGLLLGALPVRLRSGGAAAVYDALLGAERIAASLPDLLVLAKQITVAAAHIHPLAHPGHQEVDLLAGLWARAGAWPIQERAMIARTIEALDNPPEGLMRAVLPGLLVGGTSESRRAAVAEQAELLSRPELEAMLAPLSLVDREELLAVHAAENNQLALAMRSVEALFRDPASGERPADLLVDILVHWPVKAGNLLQTRLETTFDALATAGTPLHQLVALWATLLGSPARGLRTMNRMREACRAGLERPLAPGSPDIGSAAAIALILGEADRASQLVKTLGRALRTGKDADAADDLALEVLGRIAVSAPEVPQRQINPVLAPLSGFLLREGPTRIVAAINRCAATLTPGAVGILRWCAENMALLRQDIGTAAALARLGTLVDPDLFSDHLGEVLDYLRDHDPDDDGPF